MKVYVAVLVLLICTLVLYRKALFPAKKIDRDHLCEAPWPVTSTRGETWVCPVCKRKYTLVRVKEMKGLPDSWRERYGEQLGWQHTSSYADSHGEDPQEDSTKAS